MTDVIYQYTRAQAINDGVLIDVTNMAKSAGIVYPTAVTRQVWERYVKVPRSASWQDQDGRLWDVLWMLCSEVVRRGRTGPTIHFRLYVDNDGNGGKLVELKAICGPGDTADPVVTIMLPGED